MRRRNIFITALVCLLIISCIFSCSRPAGKILNNKKQAILSVKSYDIIIYGGSFSAFAAIKTITNQNPGLKVLMVVPQDKLGEIGTSAAQNFWDIMSGSRDYAKGTFKTLFNKFGQGYDPEEMAQYLMNETKKYKNLEIAFEHDVSDVITENSLIKEITVNKIQKNDKGFYVFQKDNAFLAKAKVFIDASCTGRLLRLGGFTGITGRNDYTPETRQQAVTLMFKIKGIDVDKMIKTKKWRAYADKDGTRLIWGGWGINSYKKIAAFNNKYENVYKIKSANLAEDKNGAYWANMLIMYNVDATKEYKDFGTENYPQNSYLSIEEGYLKLKEMIISNEFKEAISSFPGLENVKISGAADMLYIRESVHSSLKLNPGLNDFALTSGEAGSAGKSKNDGADKNNYKNRIGMGFYFMDSNGYFTKDAKDKYIGILHKNSSLKPRNPVYVPYEAMLNPAMKNVLICGYGANISSIAWCEMRVLPNQMVLGDASGMAACTAIQKKKNPAELSAQDISEVQKNLKAYGALIDK
ncbi:MAG: FAD-dependent oxidoreductase [Deltaproteobacteria bacterium]